MSNEQPKIDEFLKEVYMILASKDGHKVGNVFAFIGVVATVFTGYGYLFALPLKEEIKVVNTMFCDTDLYTLSLIVCCIFCCGALCLLFFISLNFGYTSAKDHHILRMISNKIGCGDLYKLQPQQVAFEPCETKKHWSNFIPDFYAGLCISAIVMQILLTIVTIVRVSNCWATFALLIVLAIVLMGQWRLWMYNFGKFKKLIKPNDNKQ